MKSGFFNVILTACFIVGAILIPDIGYKIGCGLLALGYFISLIKGS